MNPANPIPPPHQPLRKHLAHSHGVGEKAGITIIETALIAVLIVTVVIAGLVTLGYLASGP